MGAWLLVLDEPRGFPFLASKHCAPGVIMLRLPVVMVGYSPQLSGVDVALTGGYEPCAASYPVHPLHVVTLNRVQPDDLAALTTRIRLELSAVFGAGSHRYTSSILVR